MKKFKIKNRQKRKYTKRAGIQTTTPFVYTIAFGSLPLFMASLGIIATYFLSSLSYEYLGQSLISMTQITVPNISLPYISVPQIPLPSLPTFPKVQMPHITINPTPLYLFSIVLFNAVLMVQQLITTNMALTISYYSILLQTFLISIQFLLAKLVAGLLITNTIVTNAVGFIEITTWRFLEAFLIVSQICINFCTILIQKVIETLISIGTTILYYIELPFKLLAGYIEKSKPYLAYIGEQINYVSKEFTKGVDNIAKILSLLIKLSKGTSA